MQIGLWACLQSTESYTIYYKKTLKKKATSVAGIYCCLGEAQIVKYKK